MGNVCRMGCCCASFVIFCSCFYIFVRKFVHVLAWCLVHMRKFVHVLARCLVHVLYMFWHGVLCMCASTLLGDVTHVPRLDMLCFLFSAFDCIAPDTTGYVVTENELTAISFDVTVSCADGYSGTAAGATSCPGNTAGEYSVFGCAGMHLMPVACGCELGWVMFVWVCCFCVCLFFRGFFYLATACSGSYADDEPTNHFTADCSSATAHTDTCALTLSAGYTGGSVTCDTADGEYDVVVATGTIPPYIYLSLCVICDRSELVNVCLCASACFAFVWFLFYFVFYSSASIELCCFCRPYCNFLDYRQR